MNGSLPADVRIGSAPHQQQQVLRAWLHAKSIRAIAMAKLYGRDAGAVAWAAGAYTRGLGGAETECALTDADLKAEWLAGYRHERNLEGRQVPPAPFDRARAYKDE